MLRITRLPGADRTSHLRVEGRIVAQSAAELDLACRRGLGEGLVLDLARVTFVDAAGTELIRSLAREGVTLVGFSSFVRELLGTRESESGDPDEAPLVDRLRGGDAAAFETLVRTHGGRLLAVARRMMGGNEADARDVVQDALLQAHRAIASFNGTSRLSTWLHRVVVNAALMKLRSRRRRPEESIDDLLPRFEDDGHRAEERNEWATPGEELAQRRETRMMVRRLIDRLPESYRTVLLMRDIEDLDTEEVAELLGITPNAVKVRLHRGRQALKALVERELGTGGRGALVAAAS